MDLSDIRIVDIGCSLTPTDKLRISELTRESDREFVPPLSQRFSTTQQSFSVDNNHHEGLTSYLDEMFNQDFLIAIDHNKSANNSENIVGFMSYKPHSPALKSPDEKSCYISTLVVSKAYRRLGIARQLYHRISMIASEYQETISTRTWSTNASHLGLLEELGFDLIKTIKNDRLEGVDTVYYERKS